MVTGWFRSDKDSQCLWHQYMSRGSRKYSNSCTHIYEYIMKLIYYEHRKHFEISLTLLGDSIIMIIHR